MYLNIDLLNSFNSEEKNRVTKRWQSKEGLENQCYFINKIKNNELNHLLDYDVQSGKLKGFLDDERDLKGFVIQSKVFKAQGHDDFKGLDFSYSKFYNSIFDGYAFGSLNFDFCRFYNCQFLNCQFLFSTFYGSNFEKCSFGKTDFIEHNHFNNCSFLNTKFIDLFTSNSLFIDCNFDTLTHIENIHALPNNKDWNVKLDKEEKSDLYLNISEAYESGKAREKRREYLYLSKSAFTKYNAKDLKKINQLIVKWLTGYGLKPLRPILFSIVVILMSSIIFYFHFYCFPNALKTSITAFLTIGDTNSLKEPFNWIFLIEGFFGIFSLGLFLGALLNIWFSEK